MNSAVAVALPLVSFVIPARNEERHIGATLAAIAEHAGSRFAHEIIVVDNGSTDRTAALARECKADIVAQTSGTVAAVRNHGVSLACGSVLVFLDADVLVTPAWAQRIGTVLEALRANPNIVTGSRCGISRAATWIERAWFEPLLRETPNYINSGHLITSRALFDRLGGFDARLETGEDSDFSRRARAAGAQIVNDPALAVIHEGYPQTLAQFFRRERWHGKGNFVSLAAVAASRIAPLTLVFLALHVVLAAALVWARSPMSALAIAATIAALCFVSAHMKYRGTGANPLVTSALYYCYFLARSLSLFDVLAQRSKLRAAGERTHR